jgi:hypothetical protein
MKTVKARLKIKAYISKADISRHQEKILRKIMMKTSKGKRKRKKGSF